MKSDHTARILMPTVHYPPVLGGFEVFMENIAERVGRDIDFFVLTGKVFGALKREDRGKLHIRRTASLHTLRDLSYSSYWYVCTTLPALFFATIFYVKHERITLLHATGFFSGLLCLFVSRITGMPYVITIQSADFTTYHPEVRSGLLVRLQSSLERVVYQNARVCHAVSNDLVKHFVSQGRTDAVMIPNGIEAHLFHPLPESERERVRQFYSLPSSKSLAVNVSRLEAKNGVEDTIKAIALLPDVHLAVVGDGSKRRELEKLAAHEGVSKRVLFLGHLARKDVAPIVAASDVFVRTPLSEGFGIVFLEAMAAGVPVVATNVGGITDFIENGSTGLFADVRNPTSIAEAISRILSDVELRRRLISNSERLAREKYNWEDIAKRIKENVYEQALYS